MIKDFIEEVSKAGIDITENTCEDCDRDYFYGWKPASKWKKEDERLNPAATPEPPPTGNGQPVVTELIRDLLDRDKMGTKKYGTTLRTKNGRDALNDALQESLDLVMYLKQAIMERDAMVDIRGGQLMDEFILEILMEFAEEKWVAFLQRCVENGLSEEDISLEFNKIRQVSGRTNNVCDCGNDDKVFGFDFCQGCCDDPCDF